ncbi:MAG: hypothetical protein JWL81_837, partial [Verrucomicrobiales bacterium]|nr:hypothetical protein [Verrucomicrobiales bacterium]
FAGALLAGFKTRWAVIGSWLMAVSLQNRVPPILNGGDDLCRMLLFWGMFLPLGSVWSVDSRRRRRLADSMGAGTENSAASISEKVLSLATAAVMIQMALMYLCSAIFKSNADWFHGEVIAKTLAHDFYAKPMAGLILKSGFLLKLMTWGIFAFEWLAPLLLFLPRQTVRVRVLIVAALALMHLGIEICLHVGMFSYVALTGLIVFLPSEFWNRWRRFRFPMPASLPGSGIRPANVPAGNGTVARKLAGICCALALIQVLIVNIGGLVARPGNATGLAAWNFANLGLGLGQKWNMFEETPSKDGWYLARATLYNKSEIDLLRDGDPIDWTKPAHAAGIYRNHRWRKLFREMAYDDSLGYQVFRVPVARHLVREWNESRRGESSRQIVQFEFVYSMEHDSMSPDNKLVQVAVHRRLFRLDPALITPAP